MVYKTMYKGTVNSPIMTTTALISDSATTIPVDYCQNVMEGSELTVNRVAVLRRETSGVELYEKVLVASRSAATGAGNLTVIRGHASSTAREWPSGTELAVVLTAEHINDLIDNVDLVYAECGEDGDTSGNSAHAKIYDLDDRLDDVETDLTTLAGGSSTDADTMHTHASLTTKDFSGYDDKTTIHDADTLIINDSEATGTIKEVTALVLRGTTHKNLDVAKKSIIILPAGGIVPAYNPDTVTIGDTNRTGAIDEDGAGSSGTTLTITSTDHGLKTNDAVHIDLDTSNNWSGDYVVTVSSSSQFTVTLSGTPDPAVANDNGNWYTIGDVGSALFPMSLSNNYLLVSLPTPDNYDGSENLTAQFRFMPDADCSNSTNVIWGIQAAAVGNGDKLSGLFGTAVEVTTTLSTSDLVGEEIITAESSAFTPSNSPASGDRLIFRIYRKGTDTSAVDMHLTGVRVIYTTDTYGDA